MPNGEADWFLTVGGGVSTPTPGPSPTIDRGKIINVDSNPCNLKKEFIEGLSISSDISLGLLGAEVAASNFLDKSENELGTLKGGLRTSVGMNLFGNWTVDIGN